MSNTNTLIHPLIATEADILCSLQELKQLMSRRSTKLFSRNNPSEPFDIYQIYAAQNPQYKTLIDSYFLEIGISPVLATTYPDASREIALLHPNSIPASILSATSSEELSNKEISESALWWMQTYGPDGCRLSCYMQCLSVTEKIITRFQSKVPPFQRCYNRLIPSLLIIPDIVQCIG